MNRLIILCVILLIGFLFFKFGRSIYMPLLNNFKEKETIESITSKIESDVSIRLSHNLIELGLPEFPENISILAFKEEEVLQIYTNIDNAQKLIKQYKFTATSGKIGPKLKEGDKQIPEGIYNIEFLNPNSNFYLSLKVSYPNEFDKMKAELDSRTDLGKDIFIHGKDYSIGCIPIGDEAIEELFLLASKVHNKEIKVIISPRDFRQNPEFPIIENIIWEEELYASIKEELVHYKN